MELKRETWEAELLRKARREPARMGYLPLAVLGLTIVLTFGGLESSGLAAPSVLHPWLDFPTTWKTSVEVVNLGATATAVRLLAYDGAGTFLGEVPGGMTLAPGERGSYATTGTLPTGTAVLSVQADAPLASGILLEATDGRAQEVLLPASAPALDLTLPVLSGSLPWGSQLRLVNAGTALTTPTVGARDAAGQLLGRTALPALAPLASTTLDLQTLFPPPVLTTAATLQVTADQPLTALQLLGATDRPDVAALPAPLAAGTSLLLPIVTQGPTGPLWTLAGVVNPLEVPIAVTVEALDAQGRTLGPLPELVTLPARGSHLFRTPDPGGTLPAGTAALQVTAAQPVQGSVLVGGPAPAGLTALVALGPAEAPTGYDLVASPEGAVLTATPWWLGAAGQSLPALGEPGAGTWTQRLPAPTTGPSPQTAAPLAAAAAPTTGQLTLTWTDTANDFTGFKIERKTGTTGTYALLTTVGPTVFSYTDTALPVGTTYCYQVKATNAAGDSPPSNEACATVAAPVLYTLTLTKAGTGTGTVSSNPAGISCGTTCSADFISGTSVTLTATPATGSTFTGWSGACTGTGTCTVSMTQARSVTATFTLKSFTLTVIKSGTGTGTVSSSPASINCGATCSASYTYNTPVTLTAAAGTGSSFTGWSGACTGTGTCTVSMTQARSVTASFALAGAPASTGQLTLTWTDTANDFTGFKIERKTGTTGTYALLATVGPTVFSYIDTGLPVGTTYCYQVKATNAAGDSPPTNEACATVSASASSFTLTVTKAGTGSGTVTSSLAGIDCGSTCSASYAATTSVNLTATPATGSTFTGWSGACTGTGTCTVTMDAAKSVTASFTLPSYTLTVTKGGIGTGTVTSSPTGINCGSTCSASYTYNAAVTLTATPATGSSFTGWSGACAGTAACTVTMGAAKTVTATFTLQNYTLSVTNAGTGTGTVTSSPAGINCGNTCGASYAYNSSVTLTATPASGSTFTGWSGACTGTGACNVSMTQAQSATATFTLQTVALNVIKAGAGTGTMASSPTGTGTGTVTSTPAGVDCGATCSASFAFGTNVTITAAAGIGSTFTGWSGACAGITACTVMMDAAKTVTAGFVLQSFALTVAKSGTGTGTVTSNAAGVDCGTTCSASFAFGTSVTLTATTATGSTFTGWSGACAGTAACTVTMDAAKTVTATFGLIDTTPPPAPINLAANGAVGQSVWARTNGFSITWTNPSDPSSIARAFYKLGSIPTSPTDGTPAGATGFNVTATAEGGQPLYVWLEDGAGNKDHANRASVTLRYDVTPPMTRSDAPASWVGTNQALTTYLTATDAGGSGVASTQYCTDTTNACTPSTLGTSVSVGCPSGTVCQTYVRFRSVDTAGNAEAVQSALVRIDSASPAVVSNLTASGVAQTAVSLNWSAPTDSGSGNASFDLRYRIGGTFYESDWAAGIQVVGVPAPPATGMTVTGLSCGTAYTFGLRTIDRVGNISSLSNTVSPSTASCSYTNTPPSRPANIAPANGATGVPPSPTLQASAFSDPDPGDTQASSQWQIFDSTGTMLLWDSREDLINKTSRIVPNRAGLKPSTTYRWQVRYKDSHGAWSPYSAQTSLTTGRRNRH